MPWCTHEPPREFANESEKDQVHRDVAHWLTNALDR
jgi:hypothetical protein